MLHEYLRIFLFFLGIPTRIDKDQRTKRDIGTF